MSNFRADNARAAAVQKARVQMQLRAQAIRTEAVINCPVDTGRLRQSIGVQKVTDEHLRVGTNVEYAPFVEYGTRHQAAQPFMRPAFEKVKNRG